MVAVTQVFETYSDVTEHFFKKPQRVTLQFHVPTYGGIFIHYFYFLNSRNEDTYKIRILLIDLGVCTSIFLDYGYISYENISYCGMISWVRW